MAITADANPPSTSAPSPPMTTRPMRAGSATQSAVRIRGESVASVFWSEKEVPKPPRSTSSKNSTGDFAEHEQQNRKQHRGDHQRQKRDDDIFSSAAEPDGKIAPMARGDHRRIQRLCDVGHALLPNSRTVDELAEMQSGRAANMSRPAARPGVEADGDQVIEPWTPSSR